MKSRAAIVTLDIFIKRLVPFSTVVPDELAVPVRLKTKMDFVMMLDRPIKVDSLYDASVSFFIQNKGNYPTHLVKTGVRTYTPVDIDTFQYIHYTQMNGDTYYELVCKSPLELIQYEVRRNK